MPYTGCCTKRMGGKSPAPRSRHARTMVASALSKALSLSSRPQQRLPAHTSGQRTAHPPRSRAFRASKQCCTMHSSASGPRSQAVGRAARAQVRQARWRADQPADMHKAGSRSRSTRQPSTQHNTKQQPRMPKLPRGRSQQAGRKLRELQVQRAHQGQYKRFSHSTAVPHHLAIRLSSASCERGPLLRTGSA